MSRIVQGLNALGDSWARFCVDGLIQGTLALLVISAVWLLINRRVPSQVGYWLFLLVALKPFVPIEILVPRPSADSAPVASQPVPTSEEVIDINLAIQVPRVHEGAFVRPSGAPDVSISTWLMLAWFGVVMIGVARLVWIQNRTRRFIRSSVAAPNKEQQEFDWLVTQAGIRRPVKLRWNHELRTPVAACPTSPCVIVPRGLPSQLSPAQLRWTLLHELAHIRRRDLWVVMAQAMMRTLLFFNPSVWLANYIVDQLREHACDDEAAALSQIKPADAGRAFLKIIEFSGSRRTLFALEFHNSRSQVRSRMMRLINAHHDPRYRLSVPAILSLCLLAVVMLPSVKADEASKDVTIRSRIAALEAQLKALRQTIEKEEVVEEVEAVRLTGEAGKTIEYSIQLEPSDSGAKTVRSVGRFRAKTGTKGGDVVRELTVVRSNTGIATHLGSLHLGDASAVISTGGHGQHLGKHNAKISFPGSGRQQYDVFEIDTTERDKPGLLVLHVKAGSGDASASLDLFPGDVDVPADPDGQEQLRQDKSLAHLYDLPPKKSGTLIYHFRPGDKFKVGTSGNWFSEDGTHNTVSIDAMTTEYSATIHDGRGEAMRKAANVLHLKGRVKDK